MSPTLAVAMLVSRFKLGVDFLPQKAFLFQQLGYAKYAGRSVARILPTLVLSCFTVCP